MVTAYIDTPLGTAYIEGDAIGLKTISVLETQEKATNVIPDHSISGCSRERSKQCIFVSGEHHYTAGCERRTVGNQEGNF